VPWHGAHTRDITCLCRSHAQVSNWPTAAVGPPQPSQFTALQFHTDNPDAGSEFSSWNAQHVAIDGLVKQSFRSNWAGGIQSDCPGEIARTQVVPGGLRPTAHILAYLVALQGASGSGTVATCWLRRRQR